MSDIPYTTSYAVNSNFCSMTQIATLHNVTDDDRRILEFLDFGLNKMDFFGTSAKSDEYDEVILTTQLSGWIDDAHEELLDVIASISTSFFTLTDMRSLTFIFMLSFVMSFIVSRQTPDP